MSAQTYQVGAHFKAPNEPVLMAPSKILEKFFPFRLSQPPCVVALTREANEVSLSPSQDLVDGSN